jgi:transcription initiation factor TFIIIB Brf1 subunit/transcription initiation factor TFIIB
MTEIHDARYWGINQIHTLPASKDVQQFVPSKVNEIIKQNPDIKKGMEKKNVDAVVQKQFGKGFLYFKGTKGDSDTLMLTSDVNWYDELDKSDQGAIAEYESRTEGQASLRRKRYISTPTLPGFGINLKFQDSDQKHWRFNCKACGHEQHMVWPDNIDMEKKRYVCSKCKATITKEIIKKGKWKARFPDRTPDKKTGRGGIAGYQLTQMIAPWITPEDLIKAYKDAETGKNDMTFEYFYNHKLGQPYVTSSSQIPKSLILQNLVQRDHLETDSIMGMDVQLHELYAILGSSDGVYGILRIRDTAEYIETNGKSGKSKWDRWGEIMDLYGVRYCVIDGGFTPNEVIDNAKKFPGRVWVNWYKDDPSKKKIIRWADDTDFTGKQISEEEEIRVLTERDRALDWLVQTLKMGSIRFFYRPTDEAVQMLIKHIETTYARTVTDRKGNISREWVSTGKDDLLHALMYYLIALDRKRKTES